jgi:hypothetical protein
MLILYFWQVPKVRHYFSPNMLLVPPSLRLFCYSAILALMMLETRVTLLRCCILNLQHNMQKYNKSYQPALPISTHQLALAQESKN